LTFHSTTATPARILNGWKFSPIPVASVDGLRDFPSLRPTAPEGTEEYRPRIGVGTMRFEYFVATDRQLGLVVHSTAVAISLDAVERSGDAAALPDPGMSGSLCKPFDCSFGNVQISDLSITTRVVLTLMVRLFDRGNRRRI